MELREWLIILGLALVSLIVIDGIRRLKRQRRIPRLDQDDYTDTADNGMDPEEAKREAEINWELPNGGARVIKSADYRNFTGKPKLERQEHPGPSRVLSEFRRDKATSAKEVEKEFIDKKVVDKKVVEKQHPPLRAVEPAECANASTYPSSTHHSASTESTNAHSMSSVSANPQPEQKHSSDVSPLSTAEPAGSTDQTLHRMTATDDDLESSSASLSEPQSSNNVSSQSQMSAQHDTKRRQLRSSTVGDYTGETDEEDTSYQLVDFHGIKDSFKHRMQERLEERKQKKLDRLKRKEQLKAEKAERAIEAGKRKAQRAAQEAERSREAQIHADAVTARAEQAAERKANEHSKLHHSQDDNADAYLSDSHDHEPLNSDLDLATASYVSAQYAHNDHGHYEDVGDGSQGYNGDCHEDVVRPHPTLAKAMRNDVSGQHAADTLQNAEEVVIISVMSRDEEGFEGDKLLELLMMCGLRYSSDMGIFHRLETEHPESELQFSMVNVVKPGTFPIQEMDTFVTPGVTFLMPLPGAEDSIAAFEAMVETAMVVVRHMGGELKDENHSVMTAQTIEFARQRVQEFERRHHLHRVQAN